MNSKFYSEIRNILISARNKVYQTANFAMGEAYWNIRKSILEEHGGVTFLFFPAFSCVIAPVHLLFRV